MIALGGCPDSRAKSLSMRHENKYRTAYQDCCRIVVRIAVGWMGVDMSIIANDAASLMRVGTYTAELERLHLWGTDEDIDGEFNAVCQTIWGFTLDDFDDDCLVKADHDWLDELTPAGRIDLPPRTATTSVTTPTARWSQTGGDLRG
jgi:hypothetical protein